MFTGTAGSLSFVVVVGSFVTGCTSEEEKHQKAIEKVWQESIARTGDWMGRRG